SDRVRSSAPTWGMRPRGWPQKSSSRGSASDGAAPPGIRGEATVGEKSRAAASSQQAAGSQQSKVVVMETQALGAGMREPGAALSVIRGEAPVGQKSRAAASSQQAAGSLQSMLAVMATPAIGAGMAGPAPALCQAALPVSSRSLPSDQSDRRMAGPSSPTTV